MLVDVSTQLAQLKKMQARKIYNANFNFKDLKIIKLLKK